MNKHPYDLSSWKNLIPDLDKVLNEIDKHPIMAVSITPYKHLPPAFFLKNYSIYAVKRSSDADVLEDHVNLYVLEDHNKELALRVHGTGYLISHNYFRKFIDTFRVRPKMLFYTITEKIIGELDRLRIPWIGNHPKTFEVVKFKGSFRELIRSSGLPSLQSDSYSFVEFSHLTFQELWEKYEGAFVIQRGDKETGGNEGTFFVHNEEDFKKCFEVLSNDKGFNEVVVSEFVDGYSTSMLGCVVDKGVLSGSLQLQLIDVPESLQGTPATGIFFGNDHGFHPWSEEIEKDAVKAIEVVGKHLAEKGYKGIFGIDFLYDKRKEKIYAIECNPRMTGSLLLHSMMMFEAGVPPLDLFHIMAHLNIKSDYDFDQMNSALKARLPYAHIGFSPKNISHMNLNLLAGVYRYVEETGSLTYKGPGFTLRDLEDKNDFLIIDTLPKRYEPVEQNVPRLFKFIFPYSIAVSSSKIEKRAGFIVDRIASALVKASKSK